jgi:hypothetical protein
MALSRNITKEFGNVLVDNVPVLTMENPLPVLFTSTAPSFTPDTGAVVIHGGLGVGSNIVSGGTLIALNGIDLVNSSIRNLADPVSPNDPITLRYFQDHSGGISAGKGIVKNLTELSVSEDLPHVTSIGTIQNGVWNGTTIDVLHGGTGNTRVEKGQILFGNDTNALRSDPTLHYNHLTKTLSLGGTQQ